MNIYYEEYLSNQRVLHCLQAYIRQYRLTVKKYRNYSPTWKTEATWEKYWKTMNLLEDMIDGLYRVCEEYNIKTKEHWKVGYEEMQELRYYITTNANI